MRTTHSIRVGVVVGLIICLAVPARAQLVVNDPVNTIQNIALVAQAIRIYEEARRLRDIWEQFRQGIPPARRADWVIDETPWRTHGIDPEDDLFQTYLPLMTALDVGDPSGAAYMGSVVPLARYPADIVSRLRGTQLQHIAREYGTVIMADGFGRVAVEMTSDGRWHSRRALEALAALQADLLNPDEEFNGNIAMLQKSLGTRLISARTVGVGNQLLAGLVEGRLTAQKMRRDVEARRLNADVHRRLNMPEVSRQTTAQTDAVLRNFWNR